MAFTDIPAYERLRLAGETAITWAGFDSEWYLAAYPDVAPQLADRSPATVLAWYLDHGQQRGDSPNIVFDEAWHRQVYPDVAAAIRAGEVMSAFDSYCRGGFRTRSPHWLFDEGYYRRRYPDITDAALENAELANGYDHFLRHGNLEQRIGHLFFNPGLYCADLEPDGAERARTQGPFLHYLRRIRARAPEPRTTAYFDPAWYLARYKEVAEAIAAGTWMCALQHYLCNDTPTAFDPLPDFSEPYYLTHNHDLAPAIGRGDLRNGYMHFLLFGARELRAPSPAIDLHYYARQEPVRADLEQGLAPDAFWHWLRIGRSKGLNAAQPPEETVTEGQARTLWRRRGQALLPLLARHPLDFTCATAPVVSVVMLLKDEFAQTLLTLAALRASFAGAIELVLIDAGSTDETRHIGRYVRGAQLLPLEMDVDLVAGRNAALYAVTAEYVLMLQTGVELAPGALAAALRRMQAEPSVGAVGGRMIKPHGMLAEAGCIVWHDGTTLSYLRDADPLHPEASFRRSVDFCGSSCLLLRTAPLRDI
ncbi:MAG TPA: glycosyltransferase, partial [Acetobacteraceae bacterium]|nr:glycosyltransferase [Acetobacteraceae bacterium]